MCLFGLSMMAFLAQTYSLVNKYLSYPVLTEIHASHLLSFLLTIVTSQNPFSRWNLADTSSQPSPSAT